MLIFKVLSAFAAAALGAALMLSLPGFSPEVEARTPPPPAPPAVRGDRLDIRPTGLTCGEQAWPYYERDCLRDPRPNAQPRTVRIVTVDRIDR